MRIAILGATSQIAKDLILQFFKEGSHELALFARRPNVVAQWLASIGLSGRCANSDFVSFGVEEHFDAILNFVGVGNPVQAVAMGSSIFDVTLEYDAMALNYVRQHPNCRYIFLSSGAAYGSSFKEPVDEKTKASVAINNLRPHDWYSVAKLHAECRHRSLAHLPIVDIRVFNYFSHTQDLDARFLITDILRAIQFGEKMMTSSDDIVRDYISPDDFCQLVSLILNASVSNNVIDCYTKSPVSKMSLLSAMKDEFGLVFDVKESPIGVNASGIKMNYYSRNKKAKEYGYTPAKTSLENIINEVELINGFSKRSHPGKAIL